jgi:acyl-coenzyme A thioesterase PaaI-like protein
MTPIQKLTARFGFRQLMRLMRLYPPYLGAGVRVRRADPDAARVEVEMRLTRWNRNFVGTHFGGSLYSMCDPFFMLMLMRRLGPGYVVWDRSASIEFLRPGRGTVSATFELTSERVEEIRREADRSEKVLPRFEVEVVDHAGVAIARVEKVLYVRRAASTGSPSRPSSRPPSP